MPAWTQTRARLALIHYQASCRDREPDPAEVAELRQLLKAQRAETYLTEVITEKPALTAGQLEHLAAVLLTAAHGGDDAA